MKYNQEEENTTELFIDRIGLSSAIIQKNSDIVELNREILKYRYRGQDHFKTPLEETSKYCDAWGALVELYDLLKYKDFKPEDYKKKEMKEKISKLNRIMLEFHKGVGKMPKYESYFFCYETIREVITSKGYLNTNMFGSEEKPDWGSLYDEI